MRSRPVQRAVVLAPGDVITTPGGTAIRAREIARALDKSMDVTIAALDGRAGQVDGIPVAPFDELHPAGLARALQNADVVVSGVQRPPVMRVLKRARTRIVFDLYVMEPLELLPETSRLGVSGKLVADLAVDRAIDALRRGDQFVCASERQRDFWLGTMLSERLLTEARYRDDRSLRNLIDVVPFGIPEAASPGVAEDPVRQRFPEIAADDEVILWNGGIWPWADLETVIDGLERLARARPSVRLVFMGMADSQWSRQAAERIRAVSKERGIFDRHVFINDGWVPYTERAEWLAASDCALSIHRDEVETRFAFRTRVLDCIWARLPIVCTRGDELAELVERHRLGTTVEPGDAGHLAAAVEAVLDADRSSFDDGFEAVARRFAWARTAGPLVRMLEADPPPRPQYRALRPSHAGRTVGMLALRRAARAVRAGGWPRI